jgi:hypothetical protein
MCKNYLLGTCQNHRDNCDYAHGETDLLPVPVGGAGRKAAGKQRRAALKAERRAAAAAAPAAPAVGAAGAAAAAAAAGLVPAAALAAPAAPAAAPAAPAAPRPTVQPVKRPASGYGGGQGRR